MSNKHVDGKDNAADGGEVVGQSSYRNSEYLIPEHMLFLPTLILEKIRQNDMEMCLASKAVVVFEAEEFFQYTRG